MRTFQTNRRPNHGQHDNGVHTRVNTTIQPVVMEDDASTCETIMLLVGIEATCQERQQSRWHQIQLKDITVVAVGTSILHLH